MGIPLSPQDKELNKYLFTVILCAGEGHRLKEITRDIPKPLIKINTLDKKPILHHTIDSLLNLGLNRIAIVKGYLGNKIDEFINIITQENKDLKEKLHLVDAKNQYELGPLYSFLSITQNKNFYQPKYLYLIIPGDTIFQYQLLNEIFSVIKENFNENQKHPLVFFRKIKGNFFKRKNHSKLISIVKIQGENKRKFLRNITQVQLNKISNSEYVNQIIPTLLFPYNFIQEIIKIEKKISITTIREAVNHLIKQGKTISAIKIDSNYNFFDIDTKVDLIELENLG
jgi:NDP-sugar pyrophosphorylase family protein